MKAILCLLAPLLLLPTLHALESLVPKNESTERIQVLDFRAERARGPVNVWEAMPTISVFQGLINRDNPEKVYLQYFPIRTSLVPSGEAENAPGPGDPCAEWFEDGLVPFPFERVELNRSDEHPVLLWMMENYGHLVKSFALAPRQGWAGGSQADAGARTAALNACTFGDGVLYVTPHTLDYFKRKGFERPISIDTTGMSNIEAFNASKAYIDHPKRSRKALHFGSMGSFVPAMHDYFVSNYVYAFFLHPHVPEEKVAFERLLSRDYYPPATPIFGDCEGTHAIEILQGLGFMNVNGAELPNLSVHSSVPTEPQMFTPRPDGEVLDLDPNGVYISFMAMDGDALDSMTYVGFKNFRNDPARGSVPVAIRVNPYIMYLFPKLWQWYSELEPEQTDLLLSPYDGGYTTDPDGWGIRGLERNYKNFFATAGGSAAGVGFIGHGYHRLHQIAKGAPEYKFQVWGYQGTPGDFEPSFGLLDGRVYSDQIGLRGSSKYPEPGGPETVVNVDYFRNAIREHTEPGKPLFISAKVPTEVGFLPWSHAKALRDLLVEDSTIARSLYFVPMRDLMASVKSWHEAGKPRLGHRFWQIAAAGQASQQEAAELREGLRASDPLVREAAAAAIYAVGPKPADRAPLHALINSESKASTIRYAARALGDLPPDQTSIDILVSMLGSENGFAAAKGLGKMGPQVLDRLVAVVERSHSPDEALHVAATASEFGADAQPLLEGLLKDFEAVEEPHDQVVFMRAFGHMGSAARAAVPTIIRVLNDHGAPFSHSLPEMDVADFETHVNPAAIAAAAALGEIGGAEAVQALGQTLAQDLVHKRHPDRIGKLSELGIAAQIALGEVGPEAAPQLPVMLRAVESDSIHYGIESAMAVAALRERAEPAIPELIEMLHSLDRHTARLGCFKALLALRERFPEWRPQIDAALDRAAKEENSHRKSTMQELLRS